MQLLADRVGGFEFLRLPALDALGQEPLGLGTVR